MLLSEYQGNDMASKIGMCYTKNYAERTDRLYKKMSDPIV